MNYFRALDASHTTLCLLLIYTNMFPNRVTRQQIHLRLVDLAEERQSLIGLAPCSIPGCNLSKGNIENLGPVGGWGSVIAPLPERLLGLIEGSL